MSSRILYDTRDNKILRCQPKPKGVATLPSFDALCRSARLSEDDKGYADTIVIDGDYLTHTMKDDFRIVEIDNEIQVKEKPKVIILPSTTELDTSVNNILTIDINIQNILIIDNITSVDMRINDVNFSIDIADNTGSMEVELQEVDTYEVACTEDRFISQPAIVEVV